MTGVDLREHPAVAAWRRLRPGTPGPDGIELLAVRSHSTVYRLSGVGHAGTAVIAKRSPAADAAVERAVYAEVLPQVPVSSPRFYGLTADGDGCGWLFLEDVGEVRFSPLSQAHRVLAAQWLGRLHADAAGLDVAILLPDRGPAHYLDHLRAGRDTIRRHQHHPAVMPADREVLESVAAQCDALEQGWTEIERFCATVPATVVHGDFRSKNIRVRPAASGAALFPLDWETAGWGVPAADLAAPRGRTNAELVDLGTYAAFARESRPGLDAAELGRLVTVGGMFRRLAAIGWASRSLLHPWPQKALASMRVYEEDLRHLRRDWADGS